MKSAFTLIEILIVVILLGILAAIVIPQFNEATSEAETATNDTNCQAISAQAELYKFRNGAYPTGVVTSEHVLVAGRRRWSRVPQDRAGRPERRDLHGGG